MLLMFYKKEKSFSETWDIEEKPVHTVDSLFDMSDTLYSNANFDYNNYTQILLNLKGL